MIRDQSRQFHCCKWLLKVKGSITTKNRTCQQTLIRSFLDERLNSFPLKIKHKPNLVRPCRKASGRCYYKIRMKVYRSRKEAITATAMHRIPFATNQTNSRRAPGISFKSLTGAKACIRRKAAVPIAKPIANVTIFFQG